MNNIQFDSLDRSGDSLVRSVKQFDSYATTPKREQEARMRANKAVIEQTLNDPQFRFQAESQGINLDAVASGGAVAFMRELEHVYTEILRETYEPLNAKALIPIDTQVPLGKKTHTVRRIDHQGSMDWYRRNSIDEGNVSFSTDEKSYPVNVAVTKIEMNFFDQLAMGQVRSTNLEGELRNAANRVADEFYNEKTWFGDDSVGHLGVWNYPFVPKLISGVTFGPGGGTPIQQLNELIRLSRINKDPTKGVFYPTECAMPIRYMDYFQSTYIDTAGSKATILEEFRKLSNIRQVHEVHETSGAGPDNGAGANYDILFFFRRDKRAIASSVLKTLTFMPLQREGFDMYIPAYMVLGGVIMRDPLHNLVAYTNYSE